MGRFLAASVVLVGTFFCQPAGGCDDQEVVAVAGDPAESLAVCRVAARVGAFYGEVLGVDATAVPLTVVFVDGLSVSGARAGGAFDRTHRRIYVDSYAAAESQGRTRRWTHPSRAYHESIIAHEIAHAINAALFGDRLNDVADEFIAGVVQFHVMDPMVREHALTRYGYAPFPSRDYIDYLIYALLPRQFAVRSYATWLADPQILDDLVTARFVPDMMDSPT